MTGKISEDPVATTLTGLSYAAIQAGVNVQAPQSLIAAAFVPVTAVIVTSGKVLSIGNTMTLLGTDAQVITLQGTGTYIHRTSADTLTNKSMSGSANTFTNIPLATAVTGSLPATNLAMVPFFAVSVAGVNFNSANTDTPFTISLPTGFTRYVISTVRISGASASLSTATFGVFTAPAGGGVAIVSSGATITITTASENTNNNALSAVGINNGATQSYNGSTVYFRVVNAQGSAATGNVTISYFALP